MSLCAILFPNDGRRFPRVSGDEPPKRGSGTKKW